MMICCNFLYDFYKVLQWRKGGQMWKIWCTCSNHFFFSYMACHGFGMLLAHFLGTTGEIRAYSSCIISNESIYMPFKSKKTTDVIKDKQVFPKFNENFLDFFQINFILRKKLDCWIVATIVFAFTGIMCFCFHFFFPTETVSCSKDSYRGKWGQRHRAGTKA